MRHFNFMPHAMLMTYAMMLALACNGVVFGTARGSEEGTKPGSLRADDFGWLRDSDSERVKGWISTQNSHTEEKIQRDPRFKENYDAALAVYRDSRRVVGLIRDEDFVYGGWAYHLENGDGHARGLWRRARLNSYMTDSPQWETMLDLDALSRQDGKEYVFTPPQESTCYADRCLITLRVDGGFAHKEFDLKSHSFVEGGFSLPESASASVTWKDANTLLVMERPPGAATVGEMCAGNGECTVKEWSRGQPFGAAKEIARGRGMSPFSVVDDQGRRVALLAGKLTTDGLNAQRFWKLESSGPKLFAATPELSYLLGLYRGQWILSLPRDSMVGSRPFKAGALVSISDNEITNPDATGAQLVIAPPKRGTIESARVTAGGVLVTVFENAEGSVWRAQLAGGKWKTVRVPLPTNGVARPVATDSSGNTAFITYESYLRAPVRYALDVAANRLISAQAQPAHFDTEAFVTEQWEATSADGTKVPYFIVHSKGLKYDGIAPTLLYGYGGGFAFYPSYSGSMGRLWLERGGVYAHAIIRGGGEFGVNWEAKGTERQHTYEDFIAVAQDLVRRKVTSPRHLGIKGHSNGGLLCAVALNIRPDLFSAAVLENPALDQIAIMKSRPDAFLPPFGTWNDPDERAFIERTDPIFNLRPTNSFPLPLVTTNTDDEDIPAYWARKYVAKLQSLGKGAFFFEQPEGSHNPHGFTQEEAAHHDALIYTYLLQRLNTGEK